MMSVKISFNQPLRFFKNLNFDLTSDRAKAARVRLQLVQRFTLLTLPLLFVDVWLPG